MIDSWMERLMLEHMRERKRKADVQLNGRIKETIGELLAIVVALFFVGAMCFVQFAVCFWVFLFPARWRRVDFEVLLRVI